MICFSPGAAMTLALALVPIGLAAAQEVAPLPIAGQPAPAKHRDRHAKPKPLSRATTLDDAPLLPDATPAPAPHRSAGSPAPARAAPITFGMNWKASNESAAQTRIDNLTGSGKGTGAEVGLKLPF